MASTVECVEALAIVLGVGVVRGWRSALIGTGAGLLLRIVAALVTVVGASAARRAAA